MSGALIPRFTSLKGYTRSAAIGDAIAGTILAILLVPQAMAYAQLAGLPPEAGLYAAILPPLIYLFYGTSPFVSVGPVALISLVIAEAAGGAGIEPLAAAAIVGIEAGVILMVLGALRLGRLVNFISEPILLGFTAAVAVLICASQLPTLIGTNPDRAGNLIDAGLALWDVLPNWQVATAFIGASALLLLVCINRYAAPLAWKLGIKPPWRQAVAKSLPLAVMIAASVAAGVVSSDVPLVAKPSGGLPSLMLPPFDPEPWLTLAPNALAVAVVIFATATAVAKSLAGSDRSALDTSREAVALGLGNVAASLSGGYAVSASLSRSALVEDSGGKTPVAHVIGAALVLLVIAFLAPLLAYLPKAALAALVISAIFGLVKVREMQRVWAHDKAEGALIAIAFLATLIWGVMLGLAIGAIAGLAHHLWFSSLPRVTRVGTNDEGRTYRSARRESIEPTVDPALVIRIDRSIYFANAAFIEDQVFDRLGEHDTVDCVILDMRAVNTVDASGASMLQRMIDRLSAADIQVLFAATHEPVREALRSLDGTICGFHRTVEDAREACGD